MTDEELGDAIKAQIELSNTQLGDELSTKRAQMLSAYHRMGYSDDAIAREEDRSDIVDSTCSDAVENIMGEMLEALMGSRRIASFVPSGPDDIEAAKQETDAVHHILFTHNNGFLALQHWLFDGLTTMNGYTKAYRDERWEVTTENYTGQDAGALEEIIQDLEADGARAEVIKHTATEHRTIVPIQDPDIEEKIAMVDDHVQIDTLSVELINTLHDFTIKISRKKSTFKVVPCPPDEIIVSRRWNSVSLQDAPFVGHRYLTTKGELIARGLDPDQVHGLPPAAEDDFGEERLVRFDGSGLLENTGAEAIDEASCAVLVTECWFRADRDGDDIAELLYAVMGGASNELMYYPNGDPAIEEVEEIPIHAWTPFIIPHRHHGESVVERAAQIQRTKSVFQRALSDTTAFSANPRMVIGREGMTPDTLDDAQVYRPGGLIRAKDATQVVPVKLPSSAGEILPLLDYWSSQAEERTGSTRLNQGIVGDKFGKQVAGVTIAQLRDAGMTRINMIIRSFIETGFRSLMCHLHALVRRHQDKEMMISIRGEWVAVDPSQWGERSNVDPEVGLGVAGRLAKQEALREIIGQQKEIAASGSRLSGEGQLYRALSDLSQLAGFADPDRYFTDVTKLPPEEEVEEEPTPEQVLAQAQADVAKTEADTKVKALVQKETNDARNARLKEREIILKEQEIAMEDRRKSAEALLEAIADRVSVIEAREIVIPE